MKSPNPVEEATAYLQEAAHHHYFTTSGEINHIPRNAPFAALTPVPWSSDPVGMSIAVDTDSDIYPSLFVDTSVSRGILRSGLNSAGSYESYGYPDSGFADSLLSTSDTGSGSDEREREFEGIHGGADVNYAMHERYLQQVSPFLFH